MLSVAGPAVAQDERVAVVFSVMRASQWSPLAETELRGLWGLQAQAMKEIVAEARGTMRGAMGEDRDDARAEMVQQLAHVVSLALGKKKHILLKSKDGDVIESVAEPDLKAATAALNIQADLLGLKIKAGREDSGSDEDADSMVIKLMAAFERKRPILTEGIEHNDTKALPKGIAPAPTNGNSGDETGFVADSD